MPSVLDCLAALACMCARDATQRSHLKALATPIERLPNLFFFYPPLNPWDRRQQIPGLDIPELDRSASKVDVINMLSGAGVDVASLLGKVGITVSATSEKVCAPNPLTMRPVADALQIESA